MSELAASFEDEVVSYEIRSRRVVGQGNFLTLVREEVDFNGEPLQREFVEHPGAVGVIALDENGRVLTLRQYRHPIRTRAWEAPAGLLDAPDEPLLGAAQRELAEEADLVASTWHVLLDVTTSPGMSNERVRIFLARGVSPAASTFVREAEEADIELRWVPLDEVVDAALSGRIGNAILASGALAAARSRDRSWDGLRPAE
jgi:8-oxo-dGTP pyrophosphatase MutT (NUDIX family)